MKVELPAACLLDTRGATQPIPELSILSPPTPEAFVMTTDFTIKR
jgi:hypothetical protein